MCQFLPTKMFIQYVHIEKNEIQQMYQQFSQPFWTFPQKWIIIKQLIT